MDGDEDVVLQQGVRPGAVERSCPECGRTGRTGPSMIAKKKIATPRATRSTTVTTRSSPLRRWRRARTATYPASTVPHSRIEPCSADHRPVMQ